MDQPKAGLEGQRAWFLIIDSVENVAIGMHVCQLYVCACVYSCMCVCVCVCMCVCACVRP